MTGTADRQRSIERWDTILRALAAEPRRQLIVSLAESEPDETVPLPEAATRSPPHYEPELLYRELVHSHLPTLEQAGLIEWEREPLSAGRGAHFEEAAAIVGLVRSHAEELPQSLLERCGPEHVHRYGSRGGGRTNVLLRADRVSRSNEPSLRGPSDDAHRRGSHRQGLLAGRPRR